MSRSYVFVDANNNVVEIATNIASANGFTDARLVTPATATRLLIQTKNNLKSYKGQPSTLEDVFDSIDDTNQNIEEHFTAKKVMPTNPHILDYNKVNLFNYNGAVSEDRTYEVDDVID